MIGKKIKHNGQTLYCPDMYDDGLTFGLIFKDEKAFSKNTGEVCFIPESEFEDEEPIKINGDDYYDVSGYTRKDLEDMVMDEDGNIAYKDEEGEPLDLDYFFSELKWAHPEMYLIELYH